MRTCVAVAVGVFSWLLTALAFGWFFTLLFDASHFTVEVVAPLIGIATGVVAFIVARRAVRSDKSRGGSLA